MALSPFFDFVLVRTLPAYLYILFFEPTYPCSLLKERYLLGEPSPYSLGDLPYCHITKILFGLPPPF